MQIGNGASRRDDVSCDLFPGVDSCGAQKSHAIRARISRAQAEKTALVRVPGGKLKGAKLEQENGRLIWSVDIITPGQVLSKLAQNSADRAEEFVGGKK